jgi:hypothetical protein
VVAAAAVAEAAAEGAVVAVARGASAVGSAVGMMSFKVV